MTSVLNIRPATVSDFPRIVELGSRSLMDGPYAGIIRDNPEQGKKCAAMVLEHGVVLLAQKAGRVVGLLGFIVADHHFSGQRYATELMFYIEPEHRTVKGFGDSFALELMREAERLAEIMGAESFAFTAPSAAVGQFYQRYGYRELEIVYQKVLSQPHAVSDDNSDIKCRIS